MILNWLEKAMMNNPLRMAMQRYFEVPRLLKMGEKMKGGLALEVGCGRGVGTTFIFKYFSADRVHAFDLDPQMVALDKKRLRKYQHHVSIWAGDVCRIPAKDNTYDAVFDFGIIHHVPEWQDAIHEIYRVLKPGGRFYAEEVLKKYITHPIWKRLLDHPQTNRFDH